MYHCCCMWLLFGYTYIQMLRKYHKKVFGFLVLTRPLICDQ